MGSDGRRLHIFIFPLMAAGHTLPAVDVAKLLAIEGARVSLITTAGNAAAIEASTRRLTQSGHRIDILLVHPSAALPLPDNLSSATSADSHMNFLVSTSSLRPSFELLVERHRPSAIISDMFFPWTAETAAKFGIPRLIFHGTSFFTFCVKDRARPRTASSRIGNFLSNFPESKTKRPDFDALFERMKEEEKNSYGSVVNSFYELEPEFVNHYRNVIGKRAWHIGPVYLRCDIAEDNALRGVEENDNLSNIVKWLDSKAASSVLYVCFGSLSRFTEAQIKEIARGLDLSGCYFLWVARNSEKFGVFDKGIIAPGRVPQVAVLNHPAVGGFLTHCGWNSSLESIAAGIPVVTWPIFADQFFNERLLVEVLKVGVAVGTRSFSLAEEEREVVAAEEIATALGRLMGGGEEAEERRRRAAELKVAARRAVEEGGSSREDLRRLVLDLSKVEETS